MPKSLILFSGGLDSYLTLLLAKEVSEPTAVFFDYGQNMVDQELEASIKICAEEGVPLVVRKLDKETIGFNGGIVDSNNNNQEGMLMDVLTPNRNLVFITLLANYGIVKGIHEIYVGFQDKLDTTDGLTSKNLEYAIDIQDIKLFFDTFELNTTSDQSYAFLRAMEKTLFESTLLDFKIHSPLIDMSKGDIYSKLIELNKLGFALEFTRSCYNSEQRLFYWGYGCDNCPTCKFRKLGYLKAINK